MTGGNMKHVDFIRVVGIAVVFAVTQFGMATKGEAHADNPSADVIHACKANGTGVIRIVGVNGKCKKRESALHWAIAGAPGPAGPQGLPGPAAAGVVGPAGPAGEPAPVHVIGEVYGGGIVFWVDAEGQHGLIAATADQSAGISWYNGSFTVTNAVRDGVNAGGYNTERIVINQGVGNYAAQLCANYQDGYGDWYLPSKAELDLLFQQRVVVGGFAIDNYWSSTEGSTPPPPNIQVAWGQYFGSGSQFIARKDAAARVRAVRTF
jgi:hypothetical protein